MGVARERDGTGTPAFSTFSLAYLRLIALSNTLFSKNHRIGRRSSQGARPQADIIIRTASDRWGTAAEAGKHVNANVDLDWKDSINT